MKKIKRFFLFVLDSVGIGSCPDSIAFGDEGANTLCSISRNPEFNMENLKNMGFTHIDGLDYLEKRELKCRVARLSEKSKGKDTTIGHWEIAGVVSEKPLPTYPDGFPEEILAEFKAKTGRGMLCNKPYSGTEVIKDYGEEHIKSGDLIVYTSADSVFQIAAHEAVVSPEKLYEYCKITREILKGENGVGRVIARPFDGEYPFKRTARRHDFSIEPPEATMLDILRSKGFDVIGVGKIHDIFAGKGLTEYVFTENNADGMKKAREYQNKAFNGLCFINLVDFDMVYGHRNDVAGYAKAFSEFDRAFGDFLENMQPDDGVIITADHGCDPDFSGTDHTREYVPFMLYYKGIEPRNFGTIHGFDYVSKTVLELLGDKND